MSRSSPNKNSPREGDEQRRRASQHYEPEYENSIDQRAQRSPTRDTGVAVEVPITRAEQRQQRVVPVERYRHPVTDKTQALLQRGSSGTNGTGTGQSRPPSYPGPSYQEPVHPNIEPDAAPIQQSQQRRQRGYRRTEENNLDKERIPTANYPRGHAPEPTQPRRDRDREITTQSNQALPITRDRNQNNFKNTNPPKPQPSLQPSQPAPHSPIRTSQSDPIPRLNSPTVSSTVLQPLNAKVLEYAAQMNDAQAAMAVLDEEMKALQERRAEMERRLQVAKGKHDDYRRQYVGVERALKGQLDFMGGGGGGGGQGGGLGGQRGVSRGGMGGGRGGDEDSDDDERPESQQTVRQQHSSGMGSRSESWGSEGQQKSGGRFRMSKLFGAS